MGLASRLRVASWNLWRYEQRHSVLQPLDYWVLRS